MTPASLSWFQIFRLGLVQTALGAVVVLTTSTLNRIMIVELALPAMLPGALVALHYALQVLRPRLGHGSDIGGRRTPWILGGMAALALGGVGACGTTLLVLLAKRVDGHRRAAAATIVWVMMIAGFIVTTAVAGRLLDPYSPARMVAVASTVSILAMGLTVIALWHIEDPLPPSKKTAASSSAPRNTSFGAALSEAWSEPRARRFTVFVFVSMLAYSAPELILEPFAGAVFGLTPGQSTTLASVQHGGVLAGMALVAMISTAVGGRGFASMRIWTVGGCAASAVALVNLAGAGLAAPAWPLRTTVFLLGLANGVYAVAAIGSMMSLVGAGQKSREGVRMGLWGAAQAIAFGLGGLVGTLASDFARLILGSASLAYGAVFAGEAALFLVSAVLALCVNADEKPVAMRPFNNVAKLSVPE